MKRPNPYLDFLAEQLAPLGDITFRAMFGGYCVYADGVVFGLIADNELFLKVDDGNRGKFEARGLKPFKPFSFRDEVMQYYPAPAETFESLDGMREWAGSGLAAGLRAREKKNKRVEGRS